MEDTFYNICYPQLARLFEVGNIDSCLQCSKRKENYQHTLDSLNKEEKELNRKINK